MASPVLEARGLRKAVGGVVAVRDVSLSIETGELLALIGPNGAGKTTCFNLINGQLSPDAGRVALDGQDLTGLTPRQVWRRGVGRTFQVTATFGSMTVAENVQMALISHYRRLRALWPAAFRLYRDEAMALLDRVGMVDQAGRACGVLAYGDLKDGGAPPPRWWAAAVARARRSRRDRPPAPAGRRAPPPAARPR